MIANAAAIVIGASAGALDALSKILPHLPADFPLPIVIVVHLPPDRESVMPELLGAKSKIDVREAEDKEPILPGVAYLAPADYHLLIEADRRFSLSSEEPVRHSRPSIDVLFLSAADAYGSSLIGIVLTGANDDGAQGLRAIALAGGTALVQQPDTAYSSIMPAAALEACPNAISLSLDEIVAMLIGSAIYHA